MSAVAPIQPDAPRNVALINDHEDFLLKLIERNVPLEAIEKYMDLRARNAREIASQAFNEALANFRGEHIHVTRSKVVNAGPLKGTAYAVLSDFVNATAPQLAKFGLSVSWRCTRDEKDWIEIACIVRHSGGHQEETRMGGPPDEGGAKNKIQARASTISYLEKYTLKMSLGLAEQDDDDDGNGGADNQDRQQHGNSPRTDDPPPEKPSYPEAQFAENLPKWAELIHQGKKTAADIIRTVEFKGVLSDAQRKQLTDLEPPK